MKQRIENQADEFADSIPSIKRSSYTDAWSRYKKGYIAGATAEHERMAKLIEKAFVAGRSHSSWEQFKADYLEEASQPPQQESKP